ncbi:MAG: hypothetical protein KBA03_00715 [Anaerolineaceae bacterium]|nr:hypothetical protein [Anaerolineaceae bacterium]
MKKVRFLQRDLLTEQFLPAGMEVEVKERSTHVYGGPKECMLEIRGNEDAMPALLDWLRDRIEIYDDSGNPLWWGIVSRVEVPVGKVKLIADLDEMANAIQVLYTIVNTNGQGTGVTMSTDWVEDEESIQKYGRKELLLSIGESNALAADVRARVELQERAFPRIYPDIESSDNPVAVIKGIGEWETLGWQYAMVPTRLALSYQTTGNGHGYEIQAPEIKVAQSFRAATDFRLSEVSLFLRKNGGPGEVTVAVHEYINSQLPGESLAETTIAAEKIGADFSWVSGSFGDAIDLKAGDRYFLVFSCQWCDADNFYRVALDLNKGYPEGTFRVSATSSWQENAADMPFRLYRSATFLEHTAMTSSYQRLDHLTSSYAQSFLAGSAKRLVQVGLYARRVGDPGQLSISVCRNNAGQPGEIIATGTAEAINIGTAFSWLNVVLARAVEVSSATFWLVMTARQADANNFIEFPADGNQGYAGGQALKKSIGTTSNIQQDAMYRLSQNQVSAAYTSIGNAQIQLNGTTEGLAQSFRTTNNTNIHEVEIYVRKNGAPGEITVAIAEENANREPGRIIGIGKINEADVSTSFGWQKARLDLPRLEAYTSYFLIITASQVSTGNYYSLRYDGSGLYPGEKAWQKAGSEWIATNSDLPFVVRGTTGGVSLDGESISGQIVRKEAVYKRIKATDSNEIMKAEVFVRKIGSPGDLNLGVYSETLLGGVGSLLGTCSLPAKRIGNNFAWQGDWLDRPAVTSPGMNYLLKITAGNADENNYYEIGTTEGVGLQAGGSVIENDGSWTALAVDFPFRLYEPVAGHQHQTIGSITMDLGTNVLSMAMSVRPTAGLTLSSVGVYIKKIGLPSSLEIEIASDGSSVPGAIIGRAKISGDQIGTGSAWQIGALEKPIELEANKTYWLILTASGASEISYLTLTLDGAAGYANGKLLYKSGDPWTEADGDMPFRLYSNDLLETSQQIQNFLTSYGQFFRGVYVDVASGVLLESYRGGSVDAQTEIENLLENGTLDNLRLLAKVNYDQTVEVSLQPVENNYPEIMMKRDGEIYYLSGSKIEKSYDPTGKWMSLEDLLRSASYTNAVTGSQQIFIEASHWDENDKVKTTAAGWQNPYAKKVKIIDG